MSWSAAKNRLNRARRHAKKKPPGIFFGELGDDLDFDDLPSCTRCFDDGVVNLADSPDLWGEDCFSEEDCIVTCPVCFGK